MESSRGSSSGVVFWSDVSLKMCRSPAGSYCDASVLPVIIATMVFGPDDGVLVRRRRPVPRRFLQPPTQADVPECHGYESIA